MQSSLECLCSTLFLLVLIHPRRIFQRAHRGSWCRLRDILLYESHPAAPAFIDDALKLYVKVMAAHAVSCYANGVLVRVVDEDSN